MKRILLLIILFPALFLAACASQGPDEEQAPDASDGPLVTVYRAPT